MNNLNRDFYNEDMQMTNKHVKSHYIRSLREMQVKATMRKHYTSIKMAIIKKADNNKCWRGYGEIATH